MWLFLVSQQLLMEEEKILPEMINISTVHIKYINGKCFSHVMRPSKSDYYEKRTHKLTVLMLLPEL
jgi:hypothetical protein